MKKKSIQELEQDFMALDREVHNALLQVELGMRRIDKAWAAFKKNVEDNGWDNFLSNPKKD